MSATNVPTIPARTAWARALGVAVLLWVVLGGGAFAIGTQLIADRLRHSVLAAFLLDLVFLAGVAVVVLAIVAWQRAHGETLRDLGWRAPTRPVAVVVGIVYGLVWVVLGYARGGNPFAVTWERPVMAVIGVFLAFGEELAVRGFLMEQLRRGGVPAWVQVLVSALVMGAYHGVVGFSFSWLYAASSAVLFGIVSLVFLLGRRSLTPGWIAHALTHVLGDPALIQGILRGALAAG